MSESWASDVQTYVHQKSHLAYNTSQCTPVHVKSAEVSRKQREFDTMRCEFRDSEREKGVRDVMEEKLRIAREQSARRAQSVHVAKDPVFVTSKFKPSPPDFNIVSHKSKSGDDDQPITCDARFTKFQSKRIREVNIISNLSANNQADVNMCSSDRKFKPSIYHPTADTSLSIFPQLHKTESKPHHPNRKKEPNSEGKAYNIVNFDIRDKDSLKKFEFHKRASMAPMRSNSPAESKKRTYTEATDPWLLLIAK